MRLTPSCPLSSARPVVLVMLAAQLLQHLGQLAQHPHHHLGAVEQCISSVRSASVRLGMTATWDWRTWAARSPCFLQAVSSWWACLACSEHAAWWACRGFWVSRAISSARAG